MLFSTSLLVAVELHPCVLELLAQMLQIPAEMTSRRPDGRCDGAVLSPAGQRPGADPNGASGLRSAGELVCHGSIVSRPLCLLTHLAGSSVPLVLDAAAAGVRGTVPAVAPPVGGAR